MSWRKDRQHYYALKAAGKCVSCGCMKGRGVTTVRCASCNEKRNDIRNAQRREWHSVGLCRTCGDLVEDGHTRCPQCLRDKNHKRSEPIVQKQKPVPTTKKEVPEKWLRSKPFIDPDAQLLGMEDLLMIPVMEHPRVIQLCTECKETKCKGTCDTYERLIAEIKKLQRIIKAHKTE